MPIRPPLKVEVIIDGMAKGLVDISHLRIVTHEYDARIQNINLSDGRPLLTTALGVAPLGLSGKALWLRDEFTWTIVEKEGRQVLVPSEKAKA